MPSFIDVGPAVSEPQGFENVDTSRTDGRTDTRHSSPWVGSTRGLGWVGSNMIKQLDLLMITQHTIA